MATFDINNVRAQIKTLLQTVTELAFVYDYANPDVAGYPCAIFDVSNENSEMLDDSNNLRTMTWTIWILQEISVAGEQTAKTILDAAVKKVINVLEKKSNDTLSNTVDWIMPIVGRRTHVPTPNGAAFMQEVILNAKVASTIL